MYVLPYKNAFDAGASIDPHLELDNCSTCSICTFEHAMHHGVQFVHNINIIEYAKQLLNLMSGINRLIIIVAPAMKAQNMFLREGGSVYARVPKRVQNRGHSIMCVRISTALAVCLPVSLPYRTASTGVTAAAVRCSAIPDTAAFSQLMLAPSRASWHLVLL